MINCDKSQSILGKSCDIHARILSVKHGSVISSKSPSDKLQIRPAEETQEITIVAGE